MCPFFLDKIPILVYNIIGDNNMYYRLITTQDVCDIKKGTKLIYNDTVFQIKDFKIFEIIFDNCTKHYTLDNIKEILLNSTEITG